MSGLDKLDQRGTPLDQRGTPLDQRGTPLDQPEAPRARTKRIVMVAAVASNGVIGADGDIPWRIPADFAHFKRTTLGHTLVMGRATYDSIGRPLPGRTTIVLTRSPSWTAEGVLVASSLDEALALAESLDGDVMIAGGAHVYAAALPLADEQILTEVHRAPAGDTFYPAFDRDAWVETAREAQDGYDWVWLRRVTPGRAITCSP